jgi:hypothetical protein
MNIMSMNTVGAADMVAVASRAMCMR